MKSATPELLELLHEGRQFACADLFTIELAMGGFSRYCTTDIPVVWGGELYDCYGPHISGLRYRIVIGLEADEHTLTITADRDHTILGMPFLDAIRIGVLDGASVTRQRAYFESWATDNSARGLEPVGCIPVFSGYVSSIDSITRTTAEIRVKSDIAKLDMEMPRLSWQASCMHSIYSSDCGLDKESLKQTGTAGAGSTQREIVWNGATPAYFWNGTIRMASGANGGLTRTIKNSDGSKLIVSHPFPFAIAEGDIFVAYPGCDHTTSTCSTKFLNADNMRYFPFIPTAEMAL